MPSSAVPVRWKRHHASRCSTDAMSPAAARSIGTELPSRLPSGAPDHVRLILQHHVRRHDGVGDRLVGGEGGRGHPERDEQALADERLERLTRHRFNDCPGDREPRVVVRVVLARREQATRVRQTREVVRDPLDEEMVAVEAGLMAEHHLHRDGIEVQPGVRSELRQVRGDGILEAQASFLDEHHHRRRRERLGDRSDLGHRRGDHRRGEFDVRDSVHRRVGLVAHEHPGHRARYVMLHRSRAQYRRELVFDRHRREGNARGREPPRVQPTFPPPNAATIGDGVSMPGRRSSASTGASPGSAPAPRCRPSGVRRGHSGSSIGIPAPHLRRRLFERERDDHRLANLRGSRLAPVFPARHDMVGDPSEGVDVLSDVVDRSRYPTDHHRSVVHRVVER